MPELPDVAGFKQYLDSTALHQRIARSSVSDKRILEDVSGAKLARALKDSALDSTSRHGKYLFAHLRPAKRGWLVLHFGMTGGLQYYEDGDGEPDQTRLLLTFVNGHHLAYQCQRLLGMISHTGDRDAFIQDRDLGPDALDESFDVDAFRERLSGRRGAVKAALMNQSIMAGIGNVYSDEILFQAHVHPATPVDRLGDKMLGKLHQTMQRVLKIAADRGAAVDRLPRGYLLPHRGNDDDCPKCGGKIKQTKVSGRTAYFCPACQK